MDKKEKARTTEIYVTEVFGIPLVRKYVEVCSAEIKTSDSFNRMYLVLERVKIFMIISMLISAIMALCILYYPPPLFHQMVDSLLKSYSRKGDIEELQNSLSLSEVNKRRLLETLDNCTVEKAKFITTFNKEKENLDGSLRTLKRELLTAEENVRVLEGNMAKFEKNEEACRTRESLVSRNLILLNESKVAVEQNLLKAEERIGTMDENIKELKSSLEEQQGRTVELKNNLKVSEKERTDLEEKLFTAKEKIDQLEKDTEKAENSVKEHQKTVNSITVQNLALTKKFEDVKSKLVTCKDENKDHEDRHSEFEVKLEKLEKSVKVLESKLSNVTQEKQDITKKHKDTEFKLGECRNKNMDHEISNSELLTELEEVKKELKKC